MKTLVLVDMQNDFISGALGSMEAQKILPKVVEYVKTFEGNIKYTMDIHYDFDKETIELETFGKHCINSTVGQKIPQILEVELEKKAAIKVLKDTFMPNDDYDNISLWQNILEDEENQNCQYEKNEVYVCGLCTDICVLNTALYLRNYLLYDRIIVLSDLCAGTTYENHLKALDIMKLNCIEIL